MKRLDHREDYQKIEKAIEFIEANFKTQPRLEEIAKRVHLSKYHFDRLFKRWAGVSPIQFLHFLTLEYTKQRLNASGTILETAYDAGLSGPSRLHDLFVNFDAMTPGEYKTQGAGLEIEYEFCNSPFGECLLAVTARGICHLGFVGAKGRPEALDGLYSSWPRASFAQKAKPIGTLAKRIFSIDPDRQNAPFNLHIKGTNFQVNVWRALLSIPEGWVVSYQDIAAHIGHPTAFRAVANAIAINPVAYLIPCHRVIAKTGKIHRYRWGSSRKKALIAWETARLNRHEGRPDREIPTVDRQLRAGRY